MRLLDSVKRMLTSTGGAGAAVFCWVGFGRSKGRTFGVGAMKPCRGVADRLDGWSQGRSRLCLFPYLALRCRSSPRDGPATMCEKRLFAPSHGMIMNSQGHLPHRWAPKPTSVGRAGQARKPSGRTRSSSAKRGSAHPSRQGWTRSDARRLREHENQNSGHGIRESDKERVSVPHSDF